MTLFEYDCYYEKNLSVFQLYKIQVYYRYIHVSSSLVFHYDQYEISELLKPAFVIESACNDRSSMYMYSLL